MERERVRLAASPVAVYLDEDVAEEVHGALESAEVGFDVGNESVDVSKVFAVVVDRVGVIAGADHVVVTAVNAPAVAVQHFPDVLLRQQL